MRRPRTHAGTLVVAGMVCALGPSGCKVPRFRPAHEKDRGAVTSATPDIATIALPRPPSLEATSLRPRSQPRLRGAKSDLRNVYRQVAPATVIVRTAFGMGTGTIVHADGWVLTNFHVVDGLPSDRLTREVFVETGSLSPAGVMERTGQTYTAVVHKADRAIDLAILKLVDPPPGLAVAPISQTDPTPGEPVASLGHAAIGLLWAIKSGQVASVGTLATAMAELSMTPCPDDPTLTSITPRVGLVSQVEAMLIHEAFAPVAGLPFTSGLRARRPRRTVRFGSRRGDAGPKCQSASDRGRCR